MLLLPLSFLGIWRFKEPQYSFRVLLTILEPVRCVHQSSHLFAQYFCNTVPRTVPFLAVVKSHCIFYLMFCAATDIIRSVQCIAFPFGSCHDYTTNGHGGETNDNSNYATNWIKHSDKGSRVMCVLQYVPLFTAG